MEELLPLAHKIVRSGTVDIGTDIKNGVSKKTKGLAGRFTYNWNYRYFDNFNFGYTDR